MLLGAMAWVLVVIGATLVAAGLLARLIAEIRQWLRKDPVPGRAGGLRLRLYLYLWLLVVAVWLSVFVLLLVPRQ
jgi:hypothetical protein